MIEIKKITAKNTWPLRHAVMWPDKPIHYIQLPKDQEGIHFGLYADHQLCSVISLFIDGNEAQFRKFATVVAEQGKGYGSQLLHYLMQEAKHQQVQRVWCNARKDKIGFYHRFGLEETEKEFDKGGIRYVVMEKKETT